MSCQTCVMASDASSPPAISTAAQIITRRSPKRFMKAAANGPNNPNSKRRSASADEICALSQPNSRSQRNDQHAGRAHGAGRDQHGQEGDADHDPAVMDITAGESSGQRG